MTQMLFGSMYGFPQAPACPAASDEDSKLDSTTVDELDLILTAEELLAKASSQSKQRGLKMKRLREKLRAVRMQARETHCAAVRFKTMNDEAETALSALRTEYDRADSAARSLGFELAEATTQINKLRASLRRYKQQIAKLTAQEARLPTCVVCLDKQRTHALIPCGHTVLCEDCAHRLADHYYERNESFHCPICKGICQHAQKLFL